MRLIVPAAGLGVRFQEAGYTIPKPIVEARGVPMIKRVVDMFPTLQPLAIVRPSLSKAVRALGIPTVEIAHLQQGAALSILCANGRIDDHEAVLIVNSDNIFDYDMGNFLHHCSTVDGCILTFEVDSGPWSYVKADPYSVVERVAEKEPISNLATAGAYYFRTWRDLRWAICQQVACDYKINNEFYLAPCYNPLIQRGWHVEHHEINADQFISLGTPEALSKYNAGWSV